MSPLEQNRLRFASFRSVPFFAFLSKTVNNQCYNPYIFGRSFRDLSKKVWVVASIVCRFRDKSKKHHLLVLFAFYFEIGSKLMIQPILLSKDLEKIFPKMYGL